MQEPLVSIIVPVYNGEKTIERCLTSIRNQSYQNIEVFVINDGSTDHTMKILQKFADRDHRFCIIEKENSGVSNSRNIGIQLAGGKYLQFVDGDDWIAKDATRRFVTLSEKSGCEMVISYYHRVIGRKIYIKGHIPKEGLLDREEFAKYMMKAPANFYYGVMWNKFFTTRLVRQYQLKCSEELDWCEDFQFNLEYLKYAGSIYATREPLYYYVKTKGSLVATQVNLMQTIRTKRILFEYYKELYQQIDLYDSHKLKIRSFFIAVAKDTGKRKKAV